MTNPNPSNSDEIAHDTDEEPKRQAKRSHPLVRLYRATKEFARHVEESPIVRLLVVLTVFFTAYQFWQGLKINQATLAEIREAQEFRKTERELAKATFDELEESRRERRHESVSRAWQRINTKAPGNSGKVNAIEYLVSEGVSLVGIDLSCEAMGGRKALSFGENNTATSPTDCLFPTYLRKLDLDGQAVEENGNKTLVELMRSDFSGADLTNAQFKSVNLTLSLFRRAQLQGATFKNTVLTQANFSNAHLEATHFENCDVSNADFTGVTMDGSTKFDNLYAKPDQLPKGLPAWVTVKEISE